jgi:hypothetical protein
MKRIAITNLLFLLILVFFDSISLLPKFASTITTDFQTGRSCERT